MLVSVEEPADLTFDTDIIVPSACISLGGYVMNMFDLE